MKIAIMSDSHDRWDHLEKAIEVANSENCEYLLFAGDFIAPTGIPTLQRFKGKVRLVWGNNEGETVKFTRLMDKTENLKLCGDVFEEEIDGVKIFMNHYPRIVELAAKSGEFDLCIYGHTHHYHEERLGECWFINPGEIQGYQTGNVTFIIFDTTTKSLTKKIIS